MLYCLRRYSRSLSIPSQPHAQPGGAAPASGSSTVELARDGYAITSHDDDWNVMSPQTRLPTQVVTLFESDR